MAFQRMGSGASGGTSLFKYICVFSNDTTKALIDILEIDGSTINSILSTTTRSTYNFTADDGLSISVTNAQSSSTAAQLTPPSGKALKYCNFKQGSVGTLTTLAVDETLSTYCPNFGNIVLVGYA